ncbi:MAG: hypothetical protein MUF71_09935 [Candidatus Kapabacteria bacterium]|jgi:hypothetical protein|nr:hypothetical protein [Candidatus Kapabacteria bacterium]
MRTLKRPPAPSLKKDWRETLFTMSGGLCAYCTVRLEQGWEADHYLPQESFPELQDCWYNLLPSCKPCNRAKWDFVPEALRDKTIIPPEANTTTPHDFVLDARYLPHKAASERILEPTFDNAEEHLEFVPSSCEFKHTSLIGACTVKEIFAHREMTEELTKTSLTMYNLARDRSPNDTVQSVIALSKFPVLAEILLQYWQEFFPPKSSTE